MLAPERILWQRNLKKTKMSKHGGRKQWKFLEMKMVNHLLFPSFMRILLNNRNDCILFTGPGKLSGNSLHFLLHVIEQRWLNLLLFIMTGVIHPLASVAFYLMCNLLHENCLFWQLLWSTSIFPHVLQHWIWAVSVQQKLRIRFLQTSFNSILPTSILSFSWSLILEWTPDSWQLHAPENTIGNDMVHVLLVFLNVLQSFVSQWWLNKELWTFANLKHHF